VPFIRYLTFANTELLLVNNLQAHCEVLQTKCYEFEKPEFFRRVVGELVGVGSLFTEGEEHKMQRKPPPSSAFWPPTYVYSEALEPLAIDRVFLIFS
jgi:hypothetical protein